MGLSADERDKRHKFYEKHKPEIIAMYDRLKNVKKVAEELTRKWKVEVPTTTIYGLLRTWKIPLEVKVPKTKKKKAVEQGCAYTANLVGLQKAEKGFVVTAFVPTSEPWTSIMDAFKSNVRLEVSAK